MKKKNLVLWTSVFFMCLFVSNSYAIKIPVYGKAGAIISGDEVKLCPGFKLKKCAVIEIKWEDLKKQEEESREVEVVAHIIILNENEQESTHFSYPIDKIVDEELLRFR